MIVRSNDPISELRSAGNFRRYLAAVDKPAGRSGSSLDALIHIDGELVRADRSRTQVYHYNTGGDRFRADSLMAAEDCGRGVFPLKHLLRKYPTEQIVIVEINSKQESLDDVRKKIKSDGLEWLTVPDGTSGPIAKQWHVTSWPTYYVLDSDRRIRHRGIGNIGDRLIHWVEAFLPASSTCLSHRTDRLYEPRSVH